MTWNYRVVKTELGFSVFEVFYDKQGRPGGRTEKPTLGFYCETPEDVLAELELIKMAFQCPVLNIENIGMMLDEDRTS